MHGVIRSVSSEALYWIGYLFQHWFTHLGIIGVKLEKKIIDEQILKLYNLGDIYHTQDLEYVYEDLFTETIE